MPESFVHLSCLPIPTPKSPIGRFTLRTTSDLCTENIPSGSAGTSSYCCRQTTLSNGQSRRLSFKMTIGYVRSRQTRHQSLSIWGLVLVCSLCMQKRSSPKPKSMPLNHLPGISRVLKRSEEHTSEL